MVRIIAMMDCDVQTYSTYEIFGDANSPQVKVPTISKLKRRLKRRRRTKNKSGIKGMCNRRQHKYL